MDEIVFNQTLFLQLRDDKNIPDGDITILPITVDYTLLAKTRRGLRLSSGWLEEFKWESTDLNIEFLPCQEVAREYVTEFAKNYEPVSSALAEELNKAEEEYEFDEDDGERDKSKPKAKKLKTSQLSKDICALV